MRIEHSGLIRARDAESEECIRGRDRWEKRVSSGRVSVVVAIEFAAESAEPMQVRLTLSPIPRDETSRGATARGRFVKLIDNVAGSVGEAAAEAEDVLKFIRRNKLDGICRRRSGTEKPRPPLNGLPEAKRCFAFV